jgi:regulator of sirC expression with transglutaminase-like and TPR domain
MESIIEGGLFNYHPEEQADPFSPLGRFKALLARPDEAIDLGEAALIIAAQEYPGLNEGYYLDRLDAMASDVRLLLADETDPYQIISVINSYLFGTLGYKGNETDYSDPRNSYLNDVLERRVGIPITISLVYLELTKRLGLPFEGVNLPGHFIVRYFEPASRLLGKLNPGREAYEESAAPGHEPILIDPFNGGAILTEEDCVRLVREVYGRPVPLSSVFMRPATPRQFLTRMLSNLKSSYVASEAFDKALKIEEFMIAIQPKDWSEIRDRGALRYRLGQRWRAIYDFQTYLRNQPDARDAEVIRKHIRTLYQEIAERN